MANSLRDRIRDAIGKPLDPDRFETCAVDLLRPKYESLTWVPGPNDAGQDGLGKTLEGTEFLLVVTTAENFTRNLRDNITSYQDAGGNRQAVVLATSRVVPGRTQLELPAKIKEEFGVDLIEIHEREAFVDLLADHPSWRRELLGLTSGPASALTRQFQRDHADLALGLIGREDELQALSEASGDLIVFGLPGVGKSFLLEHLCLNRDWGWLVRDHEQSISDLSDEILEKKPARIIVDDAHFDVQSAARLDQLRREMGSSFDIVACCWESWKDEVAECLPAARAVHVPQLERTDIGAVLREMEVHGPPRLVAEIIDQAQGRVGLAVTLARASQESKGWDVVTGRMLTKQALAFNNRLFSEEFLYELGVIALADEHGLSQQQVEQALGRDHLAVATAIRRVASSGTIETISPYDRRLRVQPRSLRFGLVREAFFGGAGSLDLERVLDKFETRSAAALPLIVVAAQDPRLDRSLIVELIDWSDAEPASAFAELGLDEFEQSAARAPQHLPEIARAAIRAHGLRERLLKVLFEAAEGGTSRQDADSDRPLAIIRRRLSSRTTSVAERIAVVEAANRWAAQGGSPQVAAEAAMASINPEVDDSELELGSVWDRILSLLRNFPEIQPRFALDALHTWVHPGTKRDGEPFPIETKRALREAARRIIPELAKLYRDRPIVMRQLSRMARRVGVEVAGSSDPLIDALYSPRGPDEDDHPFEPTELTERAKQAVRLIAVEGAQREPSDLAVEIAGIVAETVAVRVGLPPLLTTYVAELAARLRDPVAFAHELIAQGTAPLLVEAATKELTLETTEALQALIESLLSADQYRRIGTRLALQEDAPSVARSLALSRLQPDQAADVVFYFRIGLIVADELQAIVEDSKSRLGQDVALGALHFTGTRGPDPLLLPASLLLACRDRVAGYRVADQSDTHQVWMLEQVLRRDMELCVSWIEHWLAAAAQHASEWFPRELEEVADGLPSCDKRRLIDALPPQLSTFRARRLVRGLVNGDHELIKQFLGRDDLRHLRRAMFECDLDETWMRRAGLAREAGCSAEQIAKWTMSGVFGWSGDESAERQRRIEQLVELRDLASSEACEAAIDAIDACIARFERRRSLALEEEKRERIYGSRW